VDETGPSVEERLDPFLLMRHAMKVLGDRVMLWAVLALSFLLFGYAAIRHEPWSFASACSFTVLALALMWRERKR
jgi:hypothetical protein